MLALFLKADNAPLNVKRTRTVQIPVEGKLLCLIVKVLKSIIRIVNEVNDETVDAR